MSRRPSLCPAPRKFLPGTSPNPGRALSQYPTPSLEDVQAVAKAQDLPHLQMLDEIETRPADARHSTGNAGIDDILVRHDDTEIPLPRHRQNPVVQGPQMVVDTAPAGGFIELGRIAASNYTLNHLQTMALRLVCSLLDRYTACPDLAAQHLQYTGGPGGTEKSRIIDALKDVFAARAQRHLLQITGTSGSAAARIGGTTVHSACGLDAHRSPNKPLPPFSEAKKWTRKQKMVLVVDEISMLGGATLYDVSQHLRSLRDCPEKPFGGNAVVLLMGDFYQFAPDFIGNRLDQTIVDGMQRLRVLAAETRQLYESHNHNT
ncbi:ATP-dependent DNA helicase pfh1 [Metarhizium anisopliae]